MSITAPARAAAIESGIGSAAAQPQTDLLLALGVAADQGLSAEEAARRQARWGPNAVSSHRGLGFVNEYRAGRRSSIDVTALVPGDLVDLHMGDVVPADLRVLSASGLECDESVLTGESMPASKSPDPISTGTPLAELNDCALMGTAALDASEAWGRSFPQRPAPFRGIDAAAATGQLVDALDDIGFVPEPVTAGRKPEILLHHCPFREAAEENREVVCSVHLGLMRGCSANWTRLSRRNDSTHSVDSPGRHRPPGRTWPDGRRRRPRPTRRCRERAGPTDHRAEGHGQHPGQRVTNPTRITRVRHRRQHRKQPLLAGHSSHAGHTPQDPGVTSPAHLPFRDPGR